MHAWLAVCILVQRSWEGDIRYLDPAVEQQPVQRWLWQEAMGKRSPPMWPKTHRVFDPKAHARADYHTFGAAGEMTGCCGLNVSAFCETTQTYNTMVHFSGHALNGRKQALKRGSLPHK